MAEPAAAKAHMNFLAQAAWALLQPAHLLLLCFVAGWVFALFEGTRRMGLWIGGLATAALVVLALFPVGALFLRPLENRFPQPPDLVAVDGIIVLGGGQNAVVTADRGRVALNDSGERLIEAAALIRAFPAAQVIFTGGNGPPGLTEADVTRRVFDAMGVDTGHILFEARSANTWDNARFSMNLAGPRPHETWLLVTSAYHMPRAVASFRAAGWSIVPYPVDFRLPERGGAILTPGLEGNLRNLSVALREYIGLVAYRLMGRTQELFPEP